MTMCLYYFVLECILPLCFRFCFFPVLMLSVYMWGYFWPAYIRHSDVSVPARSGHHKEPLKYGFGSKLYLANNVLWICLVFNKRWWSKNIQSKLEKNKNLKKKQIKKLCDSQQSLSTTHKRLSTGLWIALNREKIKIKFSTDTKTYRQGPVDNSLSPVDNQKPKENALVRIKGNVRSLVPSLLIK